ncbi:MAG: hypothetical protein WCW14_04405 [Candidatus Paceibacterota bacterium]|jgi:hypothetical protein
MAIFTQILETEISDGKGGKRIVRSGDKVQLLSPEEIDEIPLDSETIQKRQDHHRLLLKWLGEGPYTIHSIGIWKCQKVELRLKTNNDGNPGTYARDFKCFD